jgi:nicotinamide mononucleotide adenylyltransferase
MINEFGDNCLLIVGSANAPFSLRNFFSYQERRNFIKKIFPEIKVVGLPDYPNDNPQWLIALDDLLVAVFKRKEKIIFFAGCEEDVYLLVETGRSVRILNRFDGSGPKISATEIRDCLIHNRPLEGLVNSAIATEIQKIFRRKWEKFKKI